MVGGASAVSSAGGGGSAHGLAWPDGFAGLGAGCLPPRPTLWRRRSTAGSIPAPTVPAAAQDALRRLVADADPDPLPTQLVHGDYRSANILVAGPGIAAVIDFEEARFDHRIDELARSAVMLGTRFRDWGPVSPEVRTAFLDGYQSERRMTAVEATWWDALVLWYSLVLTPAGEDPTGWGQAALDQLRELS